MTRLIARFAAPAALIALAAGCGGASNAHVVPPEATARQSLEAALDAWKSGKPPGLIAGTSPEVHVIDRAWEKGQKLGGYQVLKENPSEADKRFSVELALADASGKKEVTYVVLGRGPVWVFREDDYAQHINMEENAPSRPAAPARPAFRRR